MLQIKGLQRVTVWSIPQATFFTCAPTVTYNTNYRSLLLYYFLMTNIISLPSVENIGLSNLLILKTQICYNPTYTNLLYSSKLQDDSCHKISLPPRKKKCNYIALFPSIILEWIYFCILLVCIISKKYRWNFNWLLTFFDFRTKTKNTITPYINFTCI